MFSALPFVNDYATNRATYNADSSYTRQFVERLSDEESLPDFEARLRQTPSPTTARELADKVLNGLADRLQYTVRYGALIDYVDDAIRGVDHMGHDIQAFVGLLARDLVIQAKVGVCVTRGVAGSKPYFLIVHAEDIGDCELTDADQPGVFSKVEFTDCRGKVKYWLNKSNQVILQIADGEQVNTELAAIPFVLVKASGVVGKINGHQVALTNLQSILATNSGDLAQSFLARQRDSFNAGNHLASIYEEIEVGRQKGLYYEKGTNAPQFVSPPAGPITECRQVVAALVDQMTSLAGLGGSTESERAVALASVAGSIGNALAAAERQLWAYCEQFTPSAYHSRVVKYPSWEKETDRQKLITDLYANAQRASGRAGMEAATILAVEQHFAGQPSSVIQAVVNSVRSAPCLLNDDTSIVRAFEGQAIPTEVACDALGCKADVAAKALAEAKEKREQMAAAAAASSAIKDGDRAVGGVGSDRAAELAAKELSQQDAGTTRGEGK